MGSPKLTPTEIAKIHQLRAETDLTLPEIAEKVGRGLSAVGRVLKNKSNGMARGKPPRVGGWEKRLSELVKRIRRIDPGVTSIDVDVEAGRYTVNRVSSEKGSLE